jgi:hypothetical protein
MPAASTITPASDATTRMIVDVYDSFLDPTVWPDEKERARLCNVYGWRGAPTGAPW